MTRKQFGIITVLMGLIVCVGLLAAKLNNNGMVDPTDLGLALAQTDAQEQSQAKDSDAKENPIDQATATTNDYFYSTKSERDQNDAATMQELKDIVNNANTSQSEKDVANQKLTNKTMIKDQEGKIEVAIKGKGFEDALCFVEENKVRIVVKATDSLTETQTANIQEVVQDITKINDVIITVNK